MCKHDDHKALLFSVSRRLLYSLALSVLVVVEDEPAAAWSLEGGGGRREWSPLPRRVDNADAHALRGEGGGKRQRATQTFVDLV